ncbi:uncharacterized protein LOC124440652 [Xenia sp. Carnegie-2017]|uniref:uncharacterized protein LOC124440652 n=1 Tax=Xenia sp. Carnegie-2017 TaxID=2897299 RepID=UPI001F040C83|nr:uncharacterized protein LOC124440652 [Xenia sp. Carnegie-2017]
MLNIDMYAAVQTAISQESDKSLNELKLRLNEEYFGATKMSREEFLLLLKDETSLSREFSAEIYIPKIVRKQHEDKGNVCMALRSEVSGNCLYSSVSLLLAVFFPSKTKRTISGPTCPVASKKAKAEKKSGNIKLELVIKLWKIICSNVARIKVIFPRPAKTKSSTVLMKLLILLTKSNCPLFYAANFINISQTRNIPFAEHVKKSDVQTKKAKLVHYQSPHVNVRDQFQH